MYNVDEKKKHIIVGSKFTVYIGKVTSENLHISSHRIKYKFYFTKLFGTLLMPVATQK